MKNVFIIKTKDELKIHLPKLTDILSQAFYSDPYYVHIMPNNNKRISQIKWWSKILLKYTLKNGSIYVSNDYTGIAMWLGSDKPMLDDVQLAMFGLILFPFKVGFKNFIRLLNISAQWEKEHHKQNKRHFYLMMIGVEPSLQKKGIGSQLMLDILKKADNEKIDCFLETVTYNNVMFYKKHTFEIIGNEKFGEDCQYWLMKRTPQLKNNVL